MTAAVSQLAALVLPTVQHLPGSFTEPPTAPKCGAWVHTSHWSPRPGRDTLTTKLKHLGAIWITPTAVASVRTPLCTIVRHCYLPHGLTWIEAPVVNDSVASMSPSSPNSATIANSSKNKRKRPSTALRGIAHPTKRTARRKSARKKSKKQKEVFWPIKDVLEEEIDEEGTSRYLVEWEGLDEDGKPFKPDWVRITIPLHDLYWYLLLIRVQVQDITDDALQAWQAKQRANSNWSNNSQANSNPSQSSCASQQARAGPELLAGAQGKEPVPRGAFDSPESRPRKRRRTVVLDSQETGELSSNNHCEVRAREAGDDLNHSLKKIIVEITRKSSFDPSEYLDVQLSQQSQQEGVLEVTQDSILQTSAVRQLQGHHESNRTIPDSQEPSAFSISEIGLSASQLNLEIFTERSLSQISNSRRQSPSAQSVSGTGAEIPSHQPDLRISGQITIPNSGVPSRSAQLAHCSESVPESPSAHLATLEKSPFQTQELFISRPVSPASSLEPAQTAVNQSQAEPDVFLQPSHTLSIYSSQTSSIRQSQSVSGALSETSSQAAQIVPHSLSHSEGIHSPLPRDFSVYNDNNNDNETVPESSRPRIDQRTSQSSSQVLSQLDGNIRIHLSAHISHGRGAQPEIPHLLPQTFTDKSSDNAVANEVLTGYDPQSSPAPHKSVQSSDHSVTRHSQRPITPNNKMEGVTSTNESEKPVSLKEKLRLIRERRFGSTPDKASDPEATEQSKEDAGANVQNTDPIRATVQDMDDLNHATQHSDELGLLHMPHHEPREFSDPPTISPALLVPSVEMTHRDDAAPMFGDSLGHAGSIEEPMFDQTTVMTTTYEPHPEEQPATLDPSALTLSIEDDIMEADDNDESPSIPTDDDQPPTGGQDSTDGLLPLHAVIPEAPEPNILPYIDPGLNEFIVTLPLASNIRPQYVEIIKECNNDLIAYNAALTTPPYLAPVPALIAKVDDMFNRLLDICDIPLDLDTLQRVSPAKVAKFVRATNSKYAFVGQFLEQVSKNTTVHRSILLVARPGPIVDLLNSLLQAYGYQSHTAGTTTTAKSWSSDHVFVTVYPSSGQPFALQNDYDVVLAFDHTYRQDLLPTVLRENPPITLILVTTTSLQHLNMRISEKIEPVIRKNYLMLALCASIDDIITPDSGYPQTHEIAALFANFVIAPDDDDFYWTAQEPAESIFERVAASSQATDVQSSLLPDVVEGQRLSKKRSLVSNHHILSEHVSNIRRTLGTK